MLGVRRKPPPPPPPPPEAKVVGRRIRQLRDARGWTQQQLADEAEMERAYLAGMEIGARNPSLRNFVKIARALGVPLADLFV
jgi:transcriptional regulator with XRE-family HTH domain